jgi:hypothetical protein
MRGVEEFQTKKSGRRLSRGAGLAKSDALHSEFKDLYRATELLRPNTYLKRQRLS